MDRNEKSRQEFALKQQENAARKARDQFAGDVQLGRAVVMDRFGNRVSAGDSVLLHLPQDPVATVLEITPSLDPRHPIGIFRVIVQIEVPMYLNANVAHGEIVRIGTSQDVQAIEKKVDAMDRAAGPHNGQGVEGAGDVQHSEVDPSDPGDPTDPGDDGDKDG